MLRRRRLSSGVRLGPPLPMRLLNKLGPLVRSLGMWPSIDIERQMRATERKYKRNNWTPEFRRALPPRAEGFNSKDADLSLFGALVIRGQFLKSMDNALALEDLIASPSTDPRRADPPAAVRARPRPHRHDAAAAPPVGACGRPLPAVLGGLHALSAPGRQSPGRQGRPLSRGQEPAAAARLGGARVQQDASHRDRRSGGVLPPLPQPLPRAARLRLRQCAELLALVGRPGACRRLPHAQAPTAGAAVAPTRTGIGC